MRLTRTGGAYIALTLLLGFAAVNTGNNLLYLIVSALLAFMAITGIAGKRNIEGYTLELQAPDEIYAGTETILTLQISNPRRILPALLLRVELNDQSTLVPCIPAGQAGTTTLSYRPLRRGYNHIESLRISSPFPVAFFVRSHAFQPEGEILAFPALRPLRTPLLADGKRSPLSGSNRSEHGQQGVIAGIYDYSGHEPLKRIHWRLSARHDTLKVKELEEEGSEPVIIDPQQLPGNDTEEKLGTAAWLIDHYLRLNRPVGLLLGEISVPPAGGRSHKLKLLKLLALAYDK